MADVVATRAEAEASAVPPLLILEGLDPFVPGSGPIATKRLGDGHSNETFLIERDGSSWALRRPPRPPFPPSAHDVMRENTILSALAGLGAPVPKTVAACEDPGPIGAPFYLMELVDGVTIRADLPEAWDDPAGRRKLCEELVEGLVAVGAPAKQPARQIRPVARDELFPRLLVVEVPDPTQQSRTRPHRIGVQVVHLGSPGNHPLRRFPKIAPENQEPERPRSRSAAFSIAAVQSGRTGVRSADNCPPAGCYR